MSLESGRKLGLTASLIAIIAPVIVVVSGGLLIFSIISAFSSAVTNGGNSAGSAASLFSAGSIILIFGSGVMSLIGFVLFVVAMHSLSQVYNEPGIFRNILYSLITIVVGVIAVVAVPLALIASREANSGLTLAGDFIFSILAVIAASFVILVVSNVFWMRAFNKLGEKSGNHNFNTAGLLVLIGAVLSIVGVGAIIGWIAWIFAAMGFNGLKPKAGETSAFTYSNLQNAAPKRFCPYCGIENTPDSVYCVICGKKIQ